jgi:hypothetical protein
MRSPGHDHELESFDEALCAWANRPSASDAMRAARRILAALPEPTELFLWRRLAAAAALIVLVFLGAWFGARSHTPAPAVLAMATPPLPENVMVFWIDSETPVYFVLSPPGSPKGNPS